MQEQEEKVPLYEPIQFVYDGIIGSKALQKEDTVNYTWYHKQILKPQPSCSLIEYVLYHTPPVYNWLRTVQAAQRASLTNYISGKPTHFRAPQKNLLMLMRDYSDRWQIARLCFQGQFYLQKADCPHNSKRTLWSLDYQYKFKTNTLELGSVYCKKCQQNIAIQSSQVKKFPEVIILKRRESKLEIGGSVYEPYFVVIKEADSELLVRIAGGQWFEIKNKTVKVVSSQNLPKEAEKWFYRRARPDSTTLKTAEVQMQSPFSTVVSPTIKKIPIQIEQSVRTVDAEKKPPPVKPQKQRLVITQSAKLRPLKQESYVPETYKPAGDYTAKIKGQYPKQKVKDEYDVEYDKGKVKKIKTKRIKKTIDFNEVHKKVKQGLVGELKPKKKVYKDHNDSTKGFFRS